MAKGLAEGNVLWQITVDESYRNKFVALCKEANVRPSLMMNALMRAFVDDIITIREENTNVG